MSGHQCLNLRVLLGGILLMLLVSAYAMEPQMNLADLKWQHRVLVVQESEDGDAEKMRAILVKNQAGIRERDILWYLRQGQTLYNNHETYDYPDPGKALRKDLEQLLLEHRPHQVLLVGKDGGVKMREKDLVINEIFNTIDAMPMRMREMREQE